VGLEVCLSSSSGCVAKSCKQVAERHVLLGQTYSGAWALYLSGRPNHDIAYVLDYLDVNLAIPTLPLSQNLVLIPTRISVVVSCVANLAAGRFLLPDSPVLSQRSYVLVVLGSQYSVQRRSLVYVARGM
jgi:hypothetical protein